MCGRYELHSSPKRIAEQFNLASTVEFAPSYNIAPTDEVPIIRLDEHGERELVKARWGLVPGWLEEPKTSVSTVNARAETVSSKPFYRDAFRHRRCLIPADGFFEWQKIGARKQPYLVRSADGDLLGFAGLWERWGRGDETFDSCVIIVTDCNELMRPIHDRMPVILPPEDYSRWLDPAARGTADLQSLLRPCPDTRLVTVKVGARVNSVKNNDPSCIAPQEDPEPAPEPRTGDLF